MSDAAKRCALRRLAALLSVGAALVAAGCSTRRTLTIDSVPTGARVWVDGRLRGTTPVAIDFVHYATFAVRLEHEGYASLAQDVGVRSEIDGYPVVDLPFELLVPSKRWTWSAHLVPLPSAPQPSEMDAALGRAHALRERTYRELAEPGTPKPSAVPRTR